MGGKLVMRSILAGAAIALALVAPVSAQTVEEQQARAALGGYRQAIEALDAAAAGNYFWPDSVVFEQGGVEGDFATYLAHHLGPEFDEIAAFDFRDVETSVVVEGDVAYATETYTYHITFKDSARAPVERRGVATSVLRRRGGEWRIVMHHSSARAPRPA